MWKQNLNLDTEIIVKEPEKLRPPGKPATFICKAGRLIRRRIETAISCAIFDDPAELPPRPKHRLKNGKEYNDFRQPTENNGKEAENEKAQVV